MGQVGWGQWQLQVQPKVLKTPGPDGGYQQTPLRDSPKPRPCHREPAGAPGLCPRAVRKGSGPGPPAAWERSVARGLKARPRVGTRDNVVSVRDSTAF